jgi:hypothetical protein
MPFTAAHPMVVLPLVRWRALRLDATCLVIGAMAPDFQYFAYGEQKGAFSHTLLGIPLWGVPVTLILAFAFHAIVKWPLLVIAPSPLAARAITAARAPWPARWTIGTVVALIVSAAIGATSHLVWDSFTHANGWGETHIAALRTMVDVPVLGPTVAFRVLQHASTLIGLTVLAIVLARALWRVDPIELPALPRAGARMLFAACIAVAVVATVSHVIRIHATDLGSLVVAPISGVLAGTLIASVALRSTALRLVTATAARDGGG